MINFISLTVGCSSVSFERLPIGADDPFCSVQPISQHHLYNILFKRAYSIPCTASNSELSALCSVFSLATAGEALTNPDSWVTSTQFHEMSMAALRLNDVLADSNVATIEAMALQCCYLYLGSETDQIQRSWNYLGITLRIAHSVSTAYSSLPHLIHMS